MIFYSSAGLYINYRMILFRNSQNAAKPDVKSRFPYDFYYTFRLVHAYAGKI